MQFIDTNIFLRFLTKDDIRKSEACLKLFQEAEDGRRILCTTESILAEVVYVLQSKKIFSYTKDVIAKNLLPIIRIKGLKIVHKNLIISALHYYAKYNIDFEDAVLASYTLNSKNNELFSYDRDFNKIEGIKRLEP